MKFTFKKEIPTGRYSSFELEKHDIKLNKKVIGTINKSQKDGLFSISLAIKKEVMKENPAPFKWITLKGRFDTAEEARQLLLKNTDLIVQKYDLYSFED